VPVAVRFHPTYPRFSGRPDPLGARRHSAGRAGHHPPQRPQIDQHIRQAGLVGDRPAAAQRRPQQPQRFGLAIHPFDHRPLGVQLFIGRRVPIDLEPQPCAGPRRQRRRAAAFFPVRVGDRAHLARRGGMEQRTAVGGPLVRHQRAGPILEREPHRHAQPGGAKWLAVGVELAVAAALAAIERDNRLATRLVIVVVDVVRIKGRIPDARAWSAAQLLFDLRHERREIADVAFIERPRALGQDDFGAVGERGDDNAGGVAPEDVHADLEAVGGLARRRGRGRCVLGRDIPALLDPEFAVGVAAGLAGFVQPTRFDELLGIVFLDPGKQRLGIPSDRVAEGRLLVGGEGGLEQVDAGGEEPRERGGRQGAQNPAELAAVRDGGGHVDAVGAGGIGHAGEPEPDDKGGMLDEEGAQISHEADVLVEFDKEGGDEGRTGVRSGSGPGAVGRALGAVRPGEGTEEGRVLLDERVRRDPGGQTGGGHGGRADGQSGRRGAPPALEHGLKIA